MQAERRSGPGVGAPRAAGIGTASRSSVAGEPCEAIHPLSFESILRGEARPEQVLDVYRGSALQLIHVCSPHQAHRHRDQGGEWQPCAQPGKRPLTGGWQKLPAQRRAEGVAELAICEAAAEHWNRGGNLGWVAPERVCILDADTPAAWEALQEGAPHGTPLQHTSKGGHAVSRLRLAVVVSSKVAQLELAPGHVADVRACSRAFVCCWPSIHASGAPYWWESMLPRSCEELPLLPARWLEQIREIGHRPASHSAPGRTQRSSGALPQGQRNRGLFERACALQARGFSDSAIEAAVRAENLESCTPPLADGEVLRIVASALRFRKGDAA